MHWYATQLLIAERTHEIEQNAQRQQRRMPEPRHGHLRRFRHGSR